LIYTTSIDHKCHRVEIARALRVRAEIHDLLSRG
jgi:hypothetical protein